MRLYSSIMIGQHDESVSGRVLAAGPMPGRVGATVGPGQRRTMPGSTTSVMIATGSFQASGWL